MRLYEELTTYTESGMYPMHMPGHKRNSRFQMKNPYEIDVTEVPATDNLHHPEGMIRRFMDELKNKYKTVETYLLVNGSTGGILSAISACCKRGDTIVMGRNCHRSVYNAVYLLELHPVYLYPEIDEKTGISLGIDAKQVKEVLEKEKASCVILTSPTYEGIVSPISEIADIVHERGIPLIVDQAHGAHFAWSPLFPETATNEGADIVIESLHKTLPAFTQTGLLHLCSDRVDKERMERYLSIYQTSSPSYLLMAGISRCIAWLSDCGEQEYKAYAERMERFFQGVNSLQHIRLWEHPQKELSKLVIRIESGRFTGRQLGEMLRKRYGIEVEMEAAGYVLAMTTVADTEEGMRTLMHALQEIDKEIPGGDAEVIREQVIIPQIACDVWEAFEKKAETVSLCVAQGRISCEYAFLYPPGIPFLVPGEVITKEVMDKIKQAKEKGLSLQGLADESGATVKVMR